MSTRRRILVIEDDAAIRRGLCDALELAGYDLIESARGDTGLGLALRQDYDLLLLDLILPGGDGLAILEELRRVRPAAAVIVLTARGDESDRLRGLRLGADDYVVKPFSVRELLARVEAVMRRTPGRPLNVAEVRIAGGAAKLDRRELEFEDGARVELSQRECELLRYLAANPERAISREELLSRVWRLDPQGVTTRTIDMHIARLREKLRDDPARPRVIVTVRGRGYKWGGARPSEA